MDYQDLKKAYSYGKILEYSLYIQKIKTFYIGSSRYFSFKAQIDGEPVTIKFYREGYGICEVSCMHNASVEHTEKSRDGYGKNENAEHCEGYIHRVIEDFRVGLVEKLEEQ